DFAAALDGRPAPAPPVVAVAVEGKRPRDRTLAAAVAAGSLVVLAFVGFLVWPRQRAAPQTTAEPVAGETIPQLVKLRREHPEDARLAVRLGHLYCAQAWWNDGLDAYEGAVAIDPRVR